MAENFGDGAYQGPSNILVWEFRSIVRSLLDAPAEPVVQHELGLASPLQGSLIQASLQHNLLHRTVSSELQSPSV